MHIPRAIGAALLVIWALPAPAHADGMPAAAAVQPAKPGCHCPRPHRHYVRRHYRAPVVAAIKRYWVDYPMPVPSPWHPGYDRAMVLNYRSPAVSGEFLAEGGYPTTPLVPGRPYFWREGPVVYQYDGMADAWIQLSQYDTRRAVMVR